MPLNWVRVEMPLGGVSTLADPVHVLPGKLLTLENARFDRPGGISKRVGYASRPLNIFSETPASVSSGFRLAEMADGEQVLFDASNLYAWDADNRQWVNRGRVGNSVVFSNLAYFDSRFSATQLDVAQANGVRVVSWASGEFQYFVSNDATTMVKGTTFIGPVFAVASFIWSIRTDGTVIEYGIIDTTQADPGSLTFVPGTFAAPALTTLSANGDLVKACRIGTTAFAVAYLDNTDGNQLHVSLRGNVSPPPEFGANWDSGEVPDECTAIFADGAANRVYVAWSIAGTGIRFAVLNATTGAQIGATITILGSDLGEPRTRLAMGRLSSSEVILCWEQRKGAAGAPPSERLPYVRWVRVNDTPAIPGGETIKICSDVAMVAKPYVSGSDVYLPVVHTGAGYGHGLIIQVASTAGPTSLDPSWRSTFAREVATADLDDLNEPTTVRGHVSNSVETDSATTLFAVRSRERFEVAKENDDAIIIGHTGVRTVAVATALSSRNWATWGNGMFVASGRPSWYDGVQCAEHGFAWPPSINRDTPQDIDNASPGAFPSAGTWINVQLIWHFQDVNGQIQQSEPSVIFGGIDVQTNGANQGFVISLRNTLLTDRAPGASAWWTTGITKAVIQTYRTESGDDDPSAERAAGTVFYRTKAYSGFPIPGHGTATVGPNTDLGGAVLAIGDVLATDELDPAIVNNEVIYTTGGILVNTGTPPAELCLSHGNRLWLAGLEDPRELWFSQPFVELEAPRFNGALRLRLPEPIFALGSLDDKLIVGTFTGLYVVSGRGPGASGDIDIGFTIERLASDLGCINHRSMVTTPMGLMMHTTRGFMLLDRSLQLQDIGAPIQGLVASLPLINVTCGTLVPGQAHVRWLANIFSGEEAEIQPIAFVYDYRIGEWSLDRFGVGNFFAMDAYAFGDKRHHSILTVNGRVLDEDLTGLLDEESFYEFTAVTPWIRLDTLQGWQRVRSVTLLGRRPSTENAPGFYTVFVGYDYNDTYSHAYQISRAQVLALPTDVFQFKIRFARQKCEAFRLMIVDADDELGGSGIGFRLSSLVFECGLKRGTMKLPQEQKQ